MALIIDQRGRLLGFNRKAQEILGLDRRLDIGNKVDFILRGEGAEGFWERMQSADSVLLRLLSESNYSRRIEKVLRRWLALPYYLYCLRLAALYYFFTSPTICA